MLFTIKRIYQKTRHQIGLRHWKGYGIHSPLVYQLVRNLSSRTPPGVPPPGCFEEAPLRAWERTLAHKTAEGLRYEHCLIGNGGSFPSGSLVILPATLSADRVRRILLQANAPEKDRIAILLFGARGTREKSGLIDRLPDNEGTVLDMDSVVLLLYDRRLYPQKFRIRTGTPLRLLPGRLFGNHFRNKFGNKKI